MSPGDAKRCNNEILKVAALFYLTICALSHANISRPLYGHTYIPHTHIYTYGQLTTIHMYTRNNIHTYTHTCTHVELSPYDSRNLCGGARGVTVIVVGSELGYQSSNPKRSCLQFTQHLGIQLFSFQQCINSRSAWTL